ncbi:MAG TPA: 2-amino-4-hydroxy-6-hydroxymethyldihydropteridine diphosphokinase [Campylobacterales bacterium]|nr:2-amino-4-hydroxy-6-hydroxymethyldihydropteridine diphosphokinase [Campylobacterales bacterium]
MRRKVLDQKNTLYFDALYPYHTSSISTKPYQATLGIGGNIGDVPRRFNRLFWYLKRSPFIDIVETSPMLKNPPFGYLDQEDFYNAIVIVKTCLRPKALLRYILGIEKRFGRQRLFQDGPRTLDIDIIFYGHEVIHTKELTVPHPSWDERASVLIPLSYLKH